MALVARISSSARRQSPALLISNGVRLDDSRGKVTIPQPLPTSSRINLVGSFSAPSCEGKGLCSRLNGSDVLYLAPLPCSPLPKCGLILDLRSPSLHLAHIELMPVS